MQERGRWSQRSERGRGVSREQGPRDSGGLRARACTRAIHTVRAWHWVTPCAGACERACMCMHVRTRARKARCKGTCMMHQPRLYLPPLRPPVSSAPCAAQSATKSRILLRVRPQGRRPGAGHQGPHRRQNCVPHKAPARQRSCPRGVFPMPRRRFNLLSRVDTLTVDARKPEQSGGPLIAPRAGGCVAPAPSDRRCPEPRDPTMSRAPAPRRGTASAA
jgi:hypothetical protein